MSKESNTLDQWIEVETVYHSSEVGTPMQIVILQNQSNQLYSAITSEKQGKRWVVNEDLVVSAREDWSDVLDDVITQISVGSDQKHHANKLWEVRK